METEILQPTPEAIAKAATLILAGEIIAFPTETVYGLGAQIFNTNAIKKIFDVKGRPSDNPLIAHISILSQADTIAKKLPQVFSILTDAFFPGPLTLVVEKKETVPDIASANLPTIGIRMPNHPVAWKLIDSVGYPLVAPSANISGKPSPTTASHVANDLHGRIPLILDGGACSVGIESTVLDISTSTPTILRPGHITKEQLENILQQPVLFSDSLSSSQIPKAPGMKYRHYAPNASVMTIDTLDQFQKLSETTDTNSAMMLTNIHLPPTHEFSVVLPLNETTLFASFRRADQENIKTIIVFIDEETKKNIGLMNRIEKATK